MTTREHSRDSKSSRLLPRTLPDRDFVAAGNELSGGAPEEIRTPDPQIRRLVKEPRTSRRRREACKSLKSLVDHQSNARTALAILQDLPRREGRDFLFGNGAGGFRGYSRAKRELDERFAARRAASSVKMISASAYAASSCRRKPASDNADSRGSSMSVVHSHERDRKSRRTSAAQSWSHRGWFGARVQFF